MSELERLAAYLLSAMNSWVPPAQHAYYETPDDTAGRYASIAGDIAEVALDPAEEPVFAGDDGRYKTALLLASIASYESSFRARVDDCRVAGDNGRAHGLWQTHAPKDAVCTDRRQAARIALEMVRASFAECRALDFADRLSLYTDGACKHDWNRSRYRVWRAVRWWTHHGELASGGAVRLDVRHPVAIAPP
jgi:hypothetical protein